MNPQILALLLNKMRSSQAGVPAASSPVSAPARPPQMNTAPQQSFLPGAGTALQMGLLGLGGGGSMLKLALPTLMGAAQGLFGSPSKTESIGQDQINRFEQQSNQAQRQLNSALSQQLASGNSSPGLWNQYNAYYKQLFPGAQVQAYAPQKLTANDVLTNVARNSPYQSALANQTNAVVNAIGVPGDSFKGTFDPNTMMVFNGKIIPKNTFNVQAPQSPSVTALNSYKANV